MYMCDNPAFSEGGGECNFPKWVMISLDVHTICTICHNYNLHITIEHDRVSYPTCSLSCGIYTFHTFGACAMLSLYIPFEFLMIDFYWCCHKVIVCEKLVKIFDIISWSWEQSYLQPRHQERLGKQRVQQPLFKSSNVLLFFYCSLLIALDYFKGTFKILQLGPIIAFWRNSSSWG